MVCEATVKFCFLCCGQQWRGTTTDDAVPDGFNEFDLLVNVKHTYLLQEMCIHVSKHSTVRGTETTPRDGVNHL